MADDSDGNDHAGAAAGNSPHSLVRAGGAPPTPGSAGSLHRASEGSRHGWVPIPHQVTHLTLKTLGLIGAFKIPWSRHSLTDEKIPQGQRKKAPGVHTLAQGCRYSAIFLNL